MRREHEFRYTQLAGILREQILSGFIRPGHYLLSEHELCKFYGLSRTSVRKSLDQLAGEGLIVKKIGQGTIVNPNLRLDPPRRKVLRIIATSPSHYVEQAFPLLLGAFADRFPLVEVKLVRFPMLDFWESLRTSREMGFEPDLVFLSNRQFAEIEEAASLQDLSADLAGRTESVYPWLLEAFRSNGLQLAAPVTFSPVYLAYNSRLFEQEGVPLPGPDWDADRFLDAATRLSRDTDGDGLVDQYGLSLSTSLSRWPVIALQNDVRFDGTAEPDALFRTLRYLHHLMFERKAAVPCSPSIRLHSRAFELQKAAMMLTTSIELAGIRDLLPFTPQMAPLPFGPARDSLLAANVFVIPKDSAVKDLAVAFLHTALEPMLQQKIMKGLGFLSVFDSVNSRLLSPMEREALLLTDDHIRGGHFLHEVFRNPQLVEELEAEMELFWCGMESARSMAERFSALLASSRR
ncbi:hypothetical protein J31TS4_30850 [Paenibacillus sp. J31TS4]|uniref:extracellular solute-binding protein n=1 Tax=Paenibacillus sp. J31TS4 TaxID=2807195 RepID=UPI001B174456|nr:extracellular solute-binding protein [Paenibacillus sp. J31TS4]GIP39805.1 hypothetical protein J31TS4_30850 [Paenibacillus sp. J31TS4]